jgi:hypothetical protein
MKFTEDIGQIPNTPLGQPIGDILFTENFQYDQIKYFEKNEVDLARARALIPEEMWNKDDPLYDSRAMSERFYQKVSSVGSDTDKITPIQFLLRGGDIRTQKENILNANCEVKNINIKQAFKTLDNFSQNVITDKNLEGNLSANGVLNLYFDKNFNFLSDKSSFNINYNITKGRLKDFSLMKKLSLFVEEDALKDVKFENLKSSLQLNNSTLNFEPIKVKTNVVDFECFGKHDLNNKIDYQFAINLLRNTKVFVKVEGFINDPKFKFNLQSDMKKVKEKVSQDKKEILKSIDKDFQLNLQESKKDKQEWEKQEKGEFIIEWEEKKDTVVSGKQFEDSEFIIEW